MRLRWNTMRWIVISTRYWIGINLRVKLSAVIMANALWPWRMPLFFERTLLWWIIWFISIIYRYFIFVVQQLIEYVVCILLIIDFVFTLHFVFLCISPVPHWCQPTSCHFVFGGMAICFCVDLETVVLLSFWFHELDIVLILFVMKSLFTEWWW